MVVKLRKSVVGQEEKANERKISRKTYPKVGALYVALTCFATHCLSCIALEAGGRSPLGSTVTKSAAFNALFRRTYDLKIIILVTNVITGLITTAMMILGNRYGVPYLYLPWLINTMKGMALYEGPALWSLANVLLPTITLPAGSFLFATFVLYAEELCIWNNAFANFQRCWKDYHYRKQHAATRIKEKLFGARNEGSFRGNDGENELNDALEEPMARRSPDEIRNHENTTRDSNSFVENQMLDVTG